ncbi:UDP-N-acetylglucosamine--N-acetylmuramyl-(pentapeptide) pyrophosphoryl -undecaprenol N-acetylglucosamine transferase [Crocosphaera subtropica ATCC 51142]|uniref:UDP-N-acetylglucosamine--N-acetylmuramyl-(pentapeptide) pyrophosphoryl-undecaprenol N-acetylglucosamine transferase n=1 Tax=Crocosphaera subtropica (strain ATCC 51142 / BH68) TaxID=43989 RepID=MURG_CROS5|nr:undecaprenyldiphospho-muramoylpentapeptide beta-N-acetylglucosaminyltransferase [Crocosphaera subtropica]B1WVP7.1 RecName: Full=UDP-N-acetylglucosamine--N-acetylmuramyl-(pentapeptide) pyrophosphoryl-undecaprenol N-acetylglucosamine transferase; AltName: Full=Undecaprenyl-PP-MurNAc-pentapeptide-UDPGlcNAc GlcNAc transferase [Crocosphaera subtropica ATCC 51142]ACB50634.1 UDP-N-acetylglucosamine--N-acetylmuramyl-(pentapeptide) pyrophosphoryl -undecaprenol N-acetylglucosamine transferase [Crocospha
MARLLIAASGTGGHVFPALGVAEKLSDYEIQWLGTPNRLEQSLVGDRYPFHTISVEGFQTRSPIKKLKILLGLLSSIFEVKQLIEQQKIDVVFTTGGYIASSAILAAKLSGIPAILHESNYIPGKVTKLLSRFCTTVALGFEGTKQYLPTTPTIWVSTPVRSQFYTSQPLDLNIPNDVPLIVIIGGSQGAVSVNQLVRQCVPYWLEMGAYVVHLTGKNDPNANSLQDPQYITLPFYDNMAGLLQRADLAVSRAGSGTLTELAITKTPAILIPYPFAAEDHQSFNAQVFVDAGAAYCYQQKELTDKILTDLVSDLLNHPDKLKEMSNKSSELAVMDSSEKLAKLIRDSI